MNRSKFIFFYGIALLLGVSVVALYGFLFDQFYYPYSPDSANYIETARNLVEGRGFVVTADLRNPDIDFIPQALFPPGYAISVASIGSLGFSYKTAALIVSRGCWSLLPVVILFSLWRIIGPWSSLTIAVLIMLSPGMTQTGFLGLSDSLFLFFVILSIGTFLRSTKSIKYMSFVFLSGVLAGLAYATRNAAIALFAAYGATFLILLIMRDAQLNTLLRKFLIWGVGVGTITGVVWLRNLLIFGELQPYHMAPSSIGLFTNIRTFLEAFITDLSGSKFIGLVAWDAKILMLLVAVILSATAYILRKRWSDWNADERLAAVLLCMYLGAGFSMVVIARTRYQWGETINLRHVLQYVWVALVLFVLLVGWHKLDRHSVLNKVLVSSFIILLVSRIAAISSDYTRERQIKDILNKSDELQHAVELLPDRTWVLTKQLKRIIAEDRDTIEKVTQLPEDTLILSNYADVLKIESQRQVRSFWRESLESLKQLGEKVDPDRDIYVFLFPRNDTLKQAKESWDSRFVSSVPNGFVGEKSPSVFIVRRDRYQY